MDKVLIPKEDYPKLLIWGKKHKDLVCKMPMPLKAVEIVFDGTWLQVKYIREENQVTAHIIYKNKKRGKMVLEIKPSGILSTLKDTTNLSHQGMREMIVMTYCTVMAFMTYAKPEQIEKREPPEIKRLDNKRPKSKCKAPITYILRHKTNATQRSSGGHHASPKGIFTVRGHYRHLRDGRTIWIKEYKKGAGDKKKRKYKLGVKNCD